MSYYIIDDSELAKRNKTFLLGCEGTVSYNAVLSVSYVDTAPATEPVDVDEAKNWCRIDVTDDDVLIQLLITAARQVCEKHANLSFIPRTITAKIINGLGGFVLPYGPVTSITTVTPRDGTDIYDANFSMDDAYGSIYTVVYEAGYASLPQNLRTALLNQIAWMYENRGDEKLSSGVGEMAKLLLNQVRSV